MSCACTWHNCVPSRNVRIQLRALLSPESLGVHLQFGRKLKHADERKFLPFPSAWLFLPAKPGFRVHCIPEVTFVRISTRPVYAR